MHSPAPAHRSSGFTLLELLVVLGLLAGIVGPKYFNQLGRSETKVARAQIEGLSKALDIYRVETGRYSSTEQGLGALVAAPSDEPCGSGPYLQKAVPVDPWGRDAPSPTDARRLAEHQGLKVLSLRAERRWSPARWRRREAFPLVLLLVGNGVLLFLIGYVVPRFSLVFEGLGSNLPWLSRVLLKVGQFIHTHQTALLGSLVPVLIALGRLERASERIREGYTLSRSLEESRLATPVSLRMLRAGEQAGMMERTADFYDEETGRWIDWFVHLFEPLLMTFISLIISVIVILMYMPIFELTSSIQ